MDRFTGGESTLYGGGDTSPVKKTRKLYMKETMNDDNNILSNTSLQRVMRKNRELQRKIERLEREIERLKK